MTQSVSRESQIFIGDKESLLHFIGLNEYRDLKTDGMRGTIQGGSSSGLTTKKSHFCNKLT